MELLRVSNPSPKGDMALVHLSIFNKHSYLRHPGLLTSSHSVKQLCIKSNQTTEEYTNYGQGTIKGRKVLVRRIASELLGIDPTGGINTILPEDIPSGGESAV